MCLLNFKTKDLIYDVQTIKYIQKNYNNDLETSTSCKSFQWFLYADEAFMQCTYKMWIERVINARHSLVEQFFSLSRANNSWPHNYGVSSPNANMLWHNTSTLYGYTHSLYALQKHTHTHFTRADYFFETEFLVALRAFVKYYRY